MHAHDDPPHVRRRDLLKAGSGLALGAALPAAVLAEVDAAPTPSVPRPVRGVPAPPRAALAAAVPARAPLRPRPLLPLPAGTIRPLGWLERQLRVQADGLGGRLDETWVDVDAGSGWLGGPGERWERGPYFLDGLLPLAWALDDAALKRKAQAFIEWMIASAREDGMFGPRDNDDWWPRMVALKCLTQYQELTGDPRVVPLLSRYFAHQRRALPARPLRDWGRFRWQDNLASVLWLHDRTGEPGLLELARLLREQGWDWRAHFDDFPFPAKTRLQDLGIGLDAQGHHTDALRDRALSGHGVNTAMGVKAGPLWSQLSGDAADRDGARRALDVLDRHHGLPIGIFSADEHFAGRSPSQGVELCTVVELMFSLEQALLASGDAALADRIERLAYNALPATFSDDMWAHQYDQQPNQVRCSHGPGPWTTNGPEANLFGLEPHFGCCTANFHQGWPKLLNSLAAADADGGLALLLYAPARLAALVGGHEVRLRIETAYPFGDTVAVVVESAGDAAFPLRMRVPGWADGFALRVNGEPVDAAARDGYVRVQRAWRAGDRIELALRAQPRAVRGPDGAVTIERGALLYALPIGERWSKRANRGLTADWEVFGTTPWNYAWVEGSALGFTAREPGRQPFGHAPFAGIVTATMRRTDAWRAEGDGRWAAPPPPSPVAAAGPEDTVALVPYAAAKLRICAFPTTPAA